MVLDDMGMVKPPMEFLIHSIDYMEYTGTNDWQEPEYANPITIDNVRVDIGSQYSASTSGKQLLYNALIFVYDGLSSPMVDFKTESKILFKGKELVITDVTPVYEAYEDRLYAVELEVV